MAQNDLIQDMQARRGLFSVCVEMLYDTGRACEKQGMDKEAREAFAAMCVLLDQIDHYDQAMAGIGGKTLDARDVDLTCPDCGEKNGVKAVANILMPEGQDPQWQEVSCGSCGEKAGFVRKDQGGAPQGYAVTVFGVTGYERDDSTIEERLAEGASIAKNGAAKPDELPSTEELKAKAVDTAGVPLAVGKNGDRENAPDRRSIQDMLTRARSKVHGPQKQAEKPDEDPNAF